MMPSVTLDDAEFGQLMFILANAEGKGITWAMVNPLMMKIGNQLRMQQQNSRSAADHIVATQLRKQDEKDVMDGKDTEVRQ